MKSTLNAFAVALITFALLLFLVTVARPRSAAWTSTLEVLAQPAAATQLEAQRQAHELQLAEVEAREADARAEQATLRLALILGALVLMTVVAAAVYAALRRSAQITIMLEGHDADMLEAQWRVIDTEMARRGYELEDSHKCQS